MVRKRPARKAAKKVIAPVSEEPKSAVPSEAVAKYLAESGEATLDQMQATVERARAMLANRALLPDGPDTHRTPYPWETAEQRMEGPYSIWFASASDYGTGEGLSIYFAVEYASDENEFRRSLSLILGREMANWADVSERVPKVPFAKQFLSAQFQAQLEAFDRGEGLPSAMSYYACYRENYS